MRPTAATRLPCASASRLLAPSVWQPTYGDPLGSECSPRNSSAVTVRTNTRSRGTGYFRKRIAYNVYWKSFGNVKQVSRRHANRLSVDSDESMSRHRADRNEAPSTWNCALQRLHVVSDCARPEHCASF